MASMAATIRGWRIAWRRQPRAAGQSESAPGVSLEQTARMAPEWGRVELRYTRTKAHHDTGSIWPDEQTLMERIRARK